MPVYDRVEARTMAAMMALRMPAKEQVRFAIVEEEPDIILARNKIIANIMQSNSGNVFSLWVDSDIFFDSSSLLQMAEVMTRHSNAGIVTGLYRGRSSPHEVTVFKYINVDNEFGFVPAYNEKATEEYLIDACGAGFMLVRNQVFIDGCSFDRVLAYSEDLSFCMRVRDAGYKIYACPGVKCGHVFKSMLEV
jgi:GT2 family glycosyltransferase